MQPKAPRRAARPPHLRSGRHGRPPRRSQAAERGAIWRREEPNGGASCSLALLGPLKSLSLGPLILVLGASKTRKTCFCIGKQHFSYMLFFGTLRLLMSFLCPSWRFSTLFNPKMAPKMDPKRDRKSEKSDQEKMFWLSTTCLAIVGRLVRSILGPKTQQTRLPVAVWRP